MSDSEIYDLIIVGGGPAVCQPVFTRCARL